MSRPMIARLVLATRTASARPAFHPSARPFVSVQQQVGLGVYSCIRSYATHRDKPTASSSDATADLLKNASSARRAAEGQESVGPFPLGVGASGRRKAWKSWSELGLGGKLVRTTQQTGNLSVIIVGGALFLILTFALTTELFATNSPSVLYSQAVDMIRASDALNPHLLPPLTFTHSPHSSAPVRGSAPIPHTFVKHPTSGRDHMLLTFWVHGRGKDDPEKLGWLKSAWRTVDEYGRQGLVAAGLIDQALPQAEDTGSSGLSTVRNAAQGEAQVESPGTLGRWFGGFTSSLRSVAPGQKQNATRGLPPPGTYKIGEVRAEYVKNASGQYTLLALFVDVPSSRSTYPGRAVIYSSPEASTEGLIGTRIR